MTLSVVFCTVIVELPEGVFRANDLLILECYADNSLSVKGPVKEEQAVNCTVKSLQFCCVICLTDERTF